MQLIVAGRGKVGRSLARAFASAGHTTQLIAARSGVRSLIRTVESQPKAIVFLAVPDGGIRELSERLAAQDMSIPRSVSFAHVSGAMGLGELQALGRRHAVGSFHPLQSFPAPRPPEAFRGIAVAVDAGRTSFLRRLKRLARDIGAKPRTVRDEDRILYHAAAVFASNYLVVLLDEAVQLLEQAGWTEREAVAGLAPLMAGALQEAASKGPTAALTGPIRRADVITVERHLRDLDRLPSGPSGPRRPSAADLYRMLGAIALEIALEAGLEPAAAEPVRRALTQKAAATRRRRRR